MVRGQRTGVHTPLYHQDVPVASLIAIKVQRWPFHDAASSTSLQRQAFHQGLNDWHNVLVGIQTSARNANYWCFSRSGHSLLLCSGLSQHHPAAGFDLAGLTSTGRALCEILLRKLARWKPVIVLHMGSATHAVVGRSRLIYDIFGHDVHAAHAAALHLFNPGCYISQQAFSALYSHVVTFSATAPLFVQADMLNAALLIDPAQECLDAVMPMDSRLQLPFSAVIPTALCVALHMHGVVSHQRSHVSLSQLTSLSTKVHEVQLLAGNFGLWCYRFHMGTFLLAPQPAQPGAATTATTSDPQQVLRTFIAALVKLRTQGGLQGCEGISIVADVLDEMRVAVVGTTPVIFDIFSTRGDAVMSAAPNLQPDVVAGLTTSGKMCAQLQPLFKQAAPLRLGATTVMQMSVTSFCGDTTTRLDSVMLLLLRSRRLIVHVAIALLSLLCLWLFHNRLTPLLGSQPF